MILYALDWIDWPASLAIIGVASTVGAYWLQNRREAREHEKQSNDFIELSSRVTSCESELDRIDSLLQGAPKQRG